MSILVIQPGMLTTVQDQGRYGYTAWGLAPSGAMDKRAAAVANILVDNAPDAAVLEFAAIGPALQFNRDAVIAVTGATFTVRIDGMRVESYKALRVRRGQKLTFGYRSAGWTGYLAVAGGIDVPKVLGSASTHVTSGIGGYYGRALQAGDVLKIKGDVEDIVNRFGHVLEPDDYTNNGDSRITFLRVVLGPHENLFTPAGLSTFFNKLFVVSNRSDRMGYSLNGQGIETIARTSDVISDGVTVGTVQIPSHGRPVIAMADHQTTGGYAKLGTIASVDIPRLVQCPPQSLVRFRMISVEEAQDLAAQNAAELKEMQRKVRIPYLGERSTRVPASRLGAMMHTMVGPGKGTATMLASMGRDPRWTRANS